MTHLPILVHDLVLILITAGVVVILFKWLKQPVVLGYIVAGFLVGPHMNLLPNVIDNASIDTWSEIGIIFLLFSLGLEFRYKKLLEVGTSAFIATIVNMALMISIGYLAGYLLGWTGIESLFLGGMLSMASTTIIIKAFADMNKQTQRFANIVFAILIIEDIAAILMMVLFSTIAASRTIEEMQFVESVLYLIFFIVIWFVVGIYIIPTVFKRIKKYLNDETLIIVSVGLCLGMVSIAHTVGFSAALGAFIMGSILAETSEAKRIEHLLRPLKNLFGAVFFVSVGMMIVPSLILAHIMPILILTALVLVFRPVFVLIGVLASGESLKVAIQAGFSLAQIGEFSFIIATMGIQLGVIGEFMYPVIVAVSVITTFTTPYGIKYSETIYNKTVKIIPKKWNRLITGRAENRNKKINISNDWGRLAKILFVPIFIYFMLAIAIILLSRMFLLPLITNQIPSTGGVIAFAVITVLLMSPFLYGIIRIRYSARFLYIRILKRSNHFSRLALLLLSLLRTVLCIALMLYVLIPLFPHVKVILIIISIIVLILIGINPRYELEVKKLESQFLGNLNNNDDFDEHGSEH
ncbi:MAG: cation:proton antiporter [Prevotellaceae bacterium]|jgi:CPA2 family monovalent cation:H+ antiporter-2|nr:cation:proton antiporter [Prevotellaceae bacterium]